MKDRARKKTQIRRRRHAKVRSTIFGVAKLPRLTVFRSNKFISAQLIDDEKGKTLVATDDKKIKTGTKTERAGKVGEALAKLAMEKKIKKVVFDRSGYLYAGRVKALGDAARKAGLKF